MQQVAAVRTPLSEAAHPWISRLVLGLLVTSRDTGVSQVRGSAVAAMQVRTGAVRGLRYGKICSVTRVVSFRFPWPPCR